MPYIAFDATGGTLLREDKIHAVSAFELANVEPAKLLVSSQLIAVSFVVNRASAMYYRRPKLLSSSSKVQKLLKYCRLLDVAVAVVAVSGRRTATIFMLLSLSQVSPIFDSLNSTFSTFCLYIRIVSGSGSCTRGRRDVPSQTVDHAFTSIHSGSVALITFT